MRLFLWRRPRRRGGCHVGGLILLIRTGTVRYGMVRCSYRARGVYWGFVQSPAESRYLFGPLAMSTRLYSCYSESDQNATALRGARGFVRVYGIPCVTSPL